MKVPSPNIVKVFWYFGIKWVESTISQYCRVCSYISVFLSDFISIFWFQNLIRGFMIDIAVSHFGQDILAP